MNILVTGGTGVLGRKVVKELLKRNVTPTILSRRVRTVANVEMVQGNLLDTSSLPQVLTNIEVIIHCATNPGKPKEDIEGTKNLLEAAKRSGVKHFVLISIVGIDTVGWMPYYRAKLEQETLVAKSGIPYSILRTAQFHEFVAMMLSSLGRKNLQWLPGGLILQPVQVEAVAVKLAKVALDNPTGRLADLVGPEPRSFVSLGKEWLAAQGKTKRVFVIPIPKFLARVWQPVAGATAEKAGESWTMWLQKHSSEINPYKVRS
jgi:uncharacterized protein YbjT (DUF2867 family)